MGTRTLKYMPLTEVTRAPRNPKCHADQAITNSIDRFGYVEPMVIDERTGRLVAGHGRLDSLANLHAAGAPAPDGIRTRNGDWLVPVIRGWASQTDAEADAYLVASNRLVELGGWNDTELAELLGDLAGNDLLELAGYSQGDLDELLAGLRPSPPANTDEDDIPEPPENPVTQPGDLWQLGPHRLLCGDSTNADDVARLMAGERAVLMATDPPYLIDYDAQNHPKSEANRGAANRNKRWDAYVESEMSDGLYEGFVLAAVAEALCDRAVVYQWHAATRAALITDAWTKAGLLLHSQVIWVKARKVLTYADFMQQHEPCFYGWRAGHRPETDRRPPVNTPTVWSIDQQGECDGIHPTQKPVELFRRPIEWHARAGELVYEPFGGSGTQIIAAHGTSRRCNTMEISPTFCDVICRRYQLHTGTIPTRDGHAVDFA